MKKIILCLSIIVATSAMSETFNNSILAKATERYVNDTNVITLIKKLKEKHSIMSISANYKRSSGGLNGTILSVKNVPGDKFVNILITDRFFCPILDWQDEDETADIITITALVKVHSFPKQVSDGTFVLEEKFDVQLINIDGINISALDSDIL